MGGADGVARMRGIMASRLAEEVERGQGECAVVPVEEGGMRGPAR